MTVTIHQSASGVLLTYSDVQGWEAELVAISAQIEALRHKASDVQKRVDAARLFMPPAAEVHAPREVTHADAPEVGSERNKADVAVNAQSTVPPSTSDRPRLTKGQFWENTISGIVSKYPEGLTYAELRDEMGRTKLGPLLRESDKAYQRAISRLAGRDAIKRAYSRVFTPDAFATFERKVASGDASHIVPQPYVRSPMGEAILKIVHANPSLLGKQIINLLREDPEFDAALSPHETGAFNIIARLVRRQQTLRRDDGRCVVGPNFPYKELGLLPERDRAPNGHAVSALAVEGDSRPSLFSNPPVARH